MDKGYDTITIEGAGKSVTMTGKEFDRAVHTMTKISVPHDSKFEDEQFIDDIQLDDIGEDLISSYDDFSEIAGARILYLWKQKGGKSNGRETLGKCQKPSGLLAHYSNADFVIWLAADHCRDYGLNGQQIRALIFHELKHAGYDPETGQYTTVSHDFEGFAREIEEFGLWDANAKRMAAAFKSVEQPTLAGMELPE